MQITIKLIPYEPPNLVLSPRDCYYVDKDGDAWWKQDVTGIEDLCE